MKLVRTTAAVAALVLVAATANAQVATSNTAQVSLTVNQNPVLTVSTNVSTATANNPASNALTPFSAVNVTTTWNQSGGTTLELVGYFSSSDALSGTAGAIPTSRVRAALGGVVTSSSAAFTSTVAGIPNAASLLAPTTFAALGGRNGTRTDPLNLALDYTGATAPTAGTYTGTLNLVAFVQ